MADPLLARYVAGWPRAGEAGVVAGAGELSGAAWWRRFPAGAPGFGFVDAATPEIAIGVAAGARGMGLGVRLLDALVARAREDGLPALSLSVQADNRRAIRLYERVAFVTVGRHGTSHTMRLDLRSAAPGGA